MKKNRALLIGLVLLVVVIGGYGTVRYVEQRVETTVGQLASAHPDVLGMRQMSFSIFNRQLVLHNVWYALSDVPGRFTVEKVMLQLPWSVILHPAAEGTVLVAEQAVMERTRWAQESSVATTREERIVNLRTDMALLQKVLDTKGVDVPAMTALLAGSACDSSESLEMEVREGEKILLQVAAISSNGWKGMELAACSVRDLRFFDPSSSMTQANTPLGSIGLLKARGIKFSEALYAGLLSASAKETLDEGALSTLWEQVSANGVPLFAELSVENVAGGTAEVPFTLKQLNIDWKQLQPMQYALSMDNLVIPVAPFATSAELVLPGLKDFDISIKNSVEENATTGYFVDQSVYEVQHLGKLTTSITLAPLPGQKSLKLMSLGNKLHVAELANFSATFEDSNLIAYLLWHLEGPDATGITLTDIIPAQDSTKEEAYLNMVDTMDTFVRNPGKLSIAFAPQKPIPLLSVLEILSDPSSHLTMTATPGTATVQDTIKQLYGPDGKGGSK